MHLAASRRARFLARMGEGVALFPTSSEQLRNGDAHFRFRPDSDFLYLTGFVEPDAMLVLAPHHPRHQVVLFVRPKDPLKEVWTGRRVGVEGALARFGVDAAFSIDELDARLPEYLEGAQRLFYRLGLNPERDRKIIAAVHTLRQAKRRLTPSPSQIIDSATILHELRLHKEPEELDLLRRAAAITAHAHRSAMAFTRPGRHEYEIEALIEFLFRRSGSVGPGYGTIVGSGENATILHYVENSARLEDGDLLLVDAGAEYQYYTADVTRTWPINGHFTPVQRAVYDIVLEAQLQAIAQVQPGTQFNEAHYTAQRVLTEGLVSLGLLKGSIDELLETEAYLPYYMHRTGHWLGLDVHDGGDYIRSGASRPLEPGMVVTVEPGLYFGPDIPDLPDEFRGIGIRIEDDVLVTSEGHEILTAAIPKRPEELEALVGTAGDSAFTLGS